MKIRYIVAGYVTLASLTFGYVWHRDCVIMDPFIKSPVPPKREYSLSVLCSTFTGAAWPAYWSVKKSVWLTSPDRKWSLPSISW